MDQALQGIRVVEAASFIAAPFCTLTLAQMGADVIRLDQIGGGPDYDRWPLATSGRSLYWEGLNKGKRSVALDFQSGEGRELAVAIITAETPEGAIFVTNFPENGFLAHHALRVRRPELLTVRITGWADGRSAFDYTVNAALGFPFQTGPAELPTAQPVNSALPAWDFITGSYAASAVLAGHHQRRQTGQGAEIQVPLGNVGLAVAGHLGQIAEATEGQTARSRQGNAIYGTFGRDFTTRDNGRVMIAAITSPQWRDLAARLNIAQQIATVEQDVGVSFATDGAARFVHRDRLFPIVEAAILRYNEGELDALFAGSRVCWGPYRTASQIVSDPKLVSESNPMFHNITHPSGLAYPTPGGPGFTVGEARVLPGRAPELGEHTEAVLSELLGLSSRQIGQLVDKNVVACR